MGLATLLPGAQATGAEVRRAHPWVGATVAIRVLTEHVLCLVHDVLHLLDEGLPLGLQDEVVLYHVGSDLIRCIPIQVELERHHLVVVRLQLTLHHLVTCVAHIQNGQPGSAGSLLAGACTRGPAVMFPGSLAFQLPPTKCTFTAVTHFSSRRDVGTSVALTALREAGLLVL